MIQVEAVSPAGVILVGAGGFVKQPASFYPPRPPCQNFLSKRRAIVAERLHFPEFIQRVLANQHAVDLLVRVARHPDFAHIEVETDAHLADRAAQRPAFWFVFVWHDGSITDV